MLLACGDGDVASDYGRPTVRRLLVVTCGVLLVVMVVAVFQQTLGDDGGPDPAAFSIEVATDDDFAIRQTMQDHRIVYRLTDPDGKVETDRLVVRAPFDSRLETALGEPPGGDTVSVQIGTIDRLAIGGVDVPATVARVPGLAPSSIRLAPIVEAAVEADLLEVREQRMVAGRRCQVHRSGTTLASGPLRPITADEFADSCIDAEGLLLEETLFIDGEAMFRRTAVDVEVDASTDDVDFTTGEPTAPVDQGGGSTLPADPESAPIGPFHVLPVDAVPAGFTLLERFSVIPPQPDRFSDPARREGIIAGVADVYADGQGDFFVVYQGGTLGRLDAFAPTPDVPSVDVGGLGGGEMLLSALGTEIRVPLPGGRFVHLIGPLDPDVLVGVGAALEEIEGEGLVLVED